MISVYLLLDFIGWKVLNRSKRSTFLHFDDYKGLEFGSFWKML